MKKLIIDEDYVIEYDEVAIQKLKLKREEIKQFNNLDIKTKMSRLNYLKSVTSDEMEIKSIVLNSRYLRLLKDSSGLHLRYESYLEDEEQELEQKIIDFLIENYPLAFDEEINSGMSGDKNRILIARGTLSED